MPLLRGMVLSLQHWEPRPYTALAVFDLGLGAESREWLSRYAAHVVVPGWDLPVAPELRESQPHQRALTVRPFLPDYFPGYGVYLWFDADAWLQEPFALEWYFAAAAGGALAITPQADRAYRHYDGIVDLRMSQMRQYYGEEAARKVLWSWYFNAGVFALPAQAPHWKLWARHFTAGLDATGGMLCHDQTALNHMLWEEKVAVHPLPAVCNWVCHLALPGYDLRRKSFCEPYAPHHAIGILHLTGEAKDAVIDLHGDGPVRKINLRFPEAALSS